MKNNYVRPSWYDYFFEVVDSISKRATCDRGRSGCVIVKDNQILSTGYVGSPPGLSHCDDVGHQFEQRKKIIKMEHVKQFKIKVPEEYKYNKLMQVYESPMSKHCIRTIHSEQNAICQAAKKGVKLDGSTLYCKMTPCRTCAMLIIASGIKFVNCEKRYHAGKESEEMFKEVGILITFRNGSIEKY